MKKKGMSLVEPLITISVFLMLVYCVYLLFDFNSIWYKRKNNKMDEIFYLEAVKNELLYNCDENDLKIYDKNTIYINDTYMDIGNIKEVKNIANIFSGIRAGDKYLEMKIENHETDRYIEINYKMKGKEFEKQGQWIKET